MSSSFFPTLSSSLSIPAHTICDVLLNFWGSEDCLKISSLFDAIKPPCPTLIILGDPVDASIISECLPSLFLLSPIPADASSIVNILLVLLGR